MSKATPPVSKASQGFGACLVHWYTSHEHELQFCHKTFIFSFITCLCLYLHSGWLLSKGNELFWARIWLSHLLPPTLLLYFRNQFHVLYSKKTTYKCHMFIHHHTVSIFQTLWQTDKAKKCISESTWMLLPQAAHGELVTAFARAQGHQEWKVFLNHLIFILLLGLQHWKAEWLVKKDSFRWDLANRYITAEHHFNYVSLRNSSSTS